MAVTQMSNLFDNAHPTMQTVEVAFFEKGRKSPWPFTASSTHTWERWRLKLKPHLLTENREQFNMYLERQLQSAMLYIAQAALENVDALPPADSYAQGYLYKVPGCLGMRAHVLDPCGDRPDRLLGDHDEAHDHGHGRGAIHTEHHVAVKCVSSASPMEHPVRCSPGNSSRALGRSGSTVAAWARATALGPRASQGGAAGHCGCSGCARSSSRPPARAPARPGAADRAPAQSIVRPRGLWSG